jgi:hypothetical protein
MMTHGDANMRRAVASMAQKCVGASHAVPAPRTQPRARSAGRCGHGFPRSHRPAEHKVKTPWLTPRCRSNPSPSSAKPIRSGPCPTSEVSMPKEPESRRNPAESATTDGTTHEHRRTHPGSARASGARTTEGTRMPQKPTRIGLDHVRRNPAGRSRRDRASYDDASQQG